MNTCDLIQNKKVKEKRMDIIDGYTIKYHANSNTMWSKGKMKNDLPDGYWVWYRKDGSVKRSGYFKEGIQVGVWTTYDESGQIHKTTIMKENSEQ